MRKNTLSRRSTFFKCKLPERAIPRRFVPWCTGCIAGCVRCLWWLDCPALSCCVVAEAIHSGWVRVFLPGGCLGSYQFRPGERSRTPPPCRQPDARTRTATCRPGNGRFEAQCRRRTLAPQAMPEALRPITVQGVAFEPVLLQDGHIQLVHSAIVVEIAWDWHIAGQ